MTGTRKKIRSLFLATLMVLSVFGGSIAFTGAGAAQANESIDLTQDSDPTEQKNNQYDTTLTSSGGPFWQGQRLAIEVRPNVTTGGVVQVREAQSRDGGGQRVGSLVREVTLNDNDEAIIDTEGIEGSFVVTTGASESDVLHFDAGLTTGGTEFGSDGTVNTGNQYDAVAEASFEVTAQNLDAQFQSDRAAQEEVYIEVDSARAGSDLLVTADGLDDDDVETILSEELTGADDDGSVTAISDASDTNSNWGDGVVVENVDSGANITANFTDIDVGDYEFEFTVTDTGVSDTSSITVDDEDDVDATILNGGVATAGQGDFAVVPIQLEETDTATVNLGYNDVNFNATFQIEDGDDDDLVTLEINTRYAGVGGSNAAANTSLDDSLTVADNEDSVDATGSGFGMIPLGGNGFITEPMDADQYDINITKNEDELDLGTVQVVEPSVDGITSWTMPSSEFSDVEEDEPAELYEYVENGQLTESDSTAQRDVLVYQIQSTSMFGELKANEDTTGNDFAEALNAITTYDDTFPANGGSYPGSFKFTIEQTDDTTRPNTDAKVVDFAESVGNGMKVVPDERNSSLFVVLKENNLALTRNDPTVANNANLGMEDGEEYEANWTVFDDSGLDSDNAAVTDTAEIVEKSIDFDTDSGGVIRVEAAPGQEITGTTSVAPGTELNVRLRSTGDTPFLEDPEATVQPDGSFTATVDLSDRAQNASFDANAQGFDSDYDTPGVIGAAPTGDVDFADQTVENGAVTVDATLSHGGFISIRTGGPEGDIVGTSDYLGEGDSTASVEVDPLSEETELYAVAHQDTNDNEALDFEQGSSTDGPYTTSNGTIVSDSAMVSPQDGQQTTTDEQQTTEDTTTEEVDTTEQEETEGEGEDEETTEGDGAGFTAVIALVALVAAALLAVRRRD